MRWIEPIVKLDQYLYRLLHDSARTPFMDALMSTVSSRRSWLPVLFVICILLIIHKRLKFLEIAVVTALAVGVTDFTTCRIIKPAVQRVRPEPSSSYSFPSGHASSSTSAAVVIGFYVPQLAPVTVVVAGMIGYSRIYIGAHYPLDVACGALLGLLISMGILYLRQRLFPPDTDNIITWWKKRTTPTNQGAETQ